MKKILLICLVLVLLCCTGCGDPTDINNKMENSTNTTKNMINGYKHANFDVYNSPAEENGLGGDVVYIEGYVESVRDDDSNNLIIVVTTNEGDSYGSWLTTFDNGVYSKELYDSLIGKEVICYGEYLGFSEKMNMPAIKLDKITTGKFVIDNSYFKNNTTTTIKETSVEDKEINKKIYTDNNIEIYYKGVGYAYGEDYLIFSIKN